MDEVIKDLKKNLSVDNIVILMKDAKVIDDMNITEEQVRNTLVDIDTEKNVEEIASKLKELSDIATKRTKEAENLDSTSADIEKKVSTTTKEDSAGYNVLQKPAELNEAADEPKPKKTVDNLYEFL